MQLRIIAKRLLLATLAVIGAVFWAQAGLADTSDKVVEFLANNLAKQLEIPFPGQCAVNIPEKEFQGDEISFDKNLAAKIVALKDIGVLRIINLPTMIGLLHFRTEIVQNQGDIFRPNPESTNCIKRAKGGDEKFGKGAATARIIKTEKVKGGKTNWDGVLIYATQTFEPTELYIKYLKAMKLPPEGKEKIRYLFKYNLFNNNWVAYTWDIAPVDAIDFSTHNVPNALQGD